MPEDTRITSGDSRNSAEMVDVITKAVLCELQRQGFDVSGAGNVPDAATCQTILNHAINVGADRVVPEAGFSRPPDGLGSYIDHTLLKPEAQPEEIDKLCREAVEHRFAAVCVNAVYVDRAVKNLEGSGIPVAAVVGFPLGAVSAAIKAAETREVVMKGAREVDMVVNIGALNAGDFKTISDEIRAVVEAAGGYPVKVILETAMLDDDHKIAACVLSKAAGAAFVKTSTGFGPSGATASDVALMRRIVGPVMGVKASGGIRDTETAEEMVSAGATRIGASASVAIVAGRRQ